MKKILSFLIALGLSFSFSTSSFSLTSNQNLTNQVVNNNKVISSTFGIATSFTPTGMPIIVPTNTIPLIPNQMYGWIILLNNTNSHIKWQEEFTLPEKPKTWGEVPLGSRIITNNGKTSIMQHEVRNENNTIHNVWAVAKGDPKGKYTIRVFADESLVGKFEFEVK
ncbi:MAG: hypothetical protein RLZZ210_1455 [Pseudomonadota bacterium]|jgi:hypothetical protein